MKLIELNKLFKIEYGNKFDLNKLAIASCYEGSVAFVSRTARNNGVVERVNLLKNIQPYPAGLITVTLGGSILSSFVQQESFYTAQNIKVLTPKRKMSLGEKLFYCVAIRQNRFRYTSHGREANKTIHQLQIPHPEDIPCWVENAKFPVTPSKLPYQSESLNLKNKEWRFFYLDDIFVVSGTKTTPAKKLKEIGIGGYPYVTTQATNNGVKGFFNHYSESGNCLCVDSAVIGYTSYQGQNFSASDHVEVLRLKEYTLNKFLAMFLTTIMNQETYRYNYGRKRSQIKLRDETIKLPATPEGAPDWQFMEDYIKSLPYSSNLE